MISSKTLMMDNPKLTCRLKGFSNYSPKRIVLDRNLNIKLNSHIFKSSKNKNTIIFYNSADIKKIKIFKKKGIVLVKQNLSPHFWGLFFYLKFYNYY